MEVFIYVEGPSDSKALEILLAGEIGRASSKGCTVAFYPMGGKGPLLNKGPQKAFNILRNRKDSHVFLLPDLYPKNVPFEHHSFQQLKMELEKRFEVILDTKKSDKRLMNRFHVHCMKYDLEVLLLASEEALKKRLDRSTFSRTWKRPVEEQDHNVPPKRIVEQMFGDCGMKYKDTVDAPLILEQVDYLELTAVCPQQFKPFIDELSRILT